jgi:hypothetical protein
MMYSIDDRNMSGGGGEGTLMIPTKQNLLDCEAFMINLVHVVIYQRKNKARGRLAKDDSARKAFCLGKGKRDLEQGKLPSNDDMRALKLPAFNEVNAEGSFLISREERSFMEEWIKKVQPSKLLAIDMKQQRSILDYMQCENQVLGRRYDYVVDFDFLPFSSPVHPTPHPPTLLLSHRVAKVGKYPSYRFGNHSLGGEFFKNFADMTISEVASHNEVTGDHVGPTFSTGVTISGR